MVQKLNNCFDRVSDSWHKEKDYCHFWNSPVVINGILQFVPASGMGWAAPIWLLHVGIILAILGIRLPGL